VIVFKTGLKAGLPGKSPNESPFELLKKPPDPLRVFFGLIVVVKNPCGLLGLKVLLKNPSARWDCLELGASLLKFGVPVFAREPLEL